jgi:DNA-binding CsgD family transcriptional regulator
MQMDEFRNGSPDDTWDILEASRGWGRPPHGSAHWIGNLRSLLDDLAYALVLVDLDGKVTYANQAAIAELDGASCLRIKAGRLSCVDSQWQAKLERDIGAAVCGRRAYSAYGSAESCTHVAFIPLAGPGEPAVSGGAVIFERRQVCDALALYFYARTHSLTGREERLLEHLATGQCVSRIADTVGVKVNTVRTHVRHILQKTGHSTLRELIAKLARLPPVAARLVGGGAPESTIVGEAPDSEDAVPHPRGARHSN